MDEEDRKYWLSLTHIDTIIDYGGRESGKTFGQSLWKCIAAADYGHRIYSARVTKDSTDDSTAASIANRIIDLGYSPLLKKVGDTFFSFDDDGKPDKGKISIVGLTAATLNQTAKNKSLEDFSIFDVDEAEELKSYKEWKKTKRSLRAKDVQCISILSFNPPSQDHWLYEEFFETRGIEDGFSGIVGNVLYIYTSYLDNADGDNANGNVAEQNWNEFERLRVSYETYENTHRKKRKQLPAKIKKDWKEYKYDVLGHFSPVAEGVIIEHWERGEFDTSLPFGFGLDFGSSDPDALVRVAIDFKAEKLYLKEEFYDNNQGYKQIRGVLSNRCGYNNLIVADDNERRLRLDLEDDGFNIEKAIKGSGSVAHTIKHLQDFIWIIDPESINLIKSVNRWTWNDKRANIPNHEWSHLPKAVGYYVIYQISGGSGEINW